MWKTEDRACLALEKLLNVARDDIGRNIRVANVILAGWDASNHDGYNLTELSKQPGATSDVLPFPWRCVVVRRGV